MTNHTGPISLLEQVYEHAEGVLVEIGPDHHELSTPCTEWNVHELVNHMIGGFGEVVVGPRRLFAVALDVVAVEMGGDCGAVDAEVRSELGDRGTGSVRRDQVVDVSGGEASLGRV